MLNVDTYVFSDRFKDFITLQSIFSELLTYENYFHLLKPATNSKLNCQK